MLRSSFRFVVARNLPLHRRAKPVWLAAIVLAGCGGANEPATQLVRGPGYRFRAPADWTVKRVPHVVSAERPGSGVDLVSVSRFRLPKVPTDTEIEAAARVLARSLRGKVTAAGTTEVAGRRARRYEIAYTRGGEDRAVRLIFVLRGRLEFQLLCRWKAPADKDVSRACDGLSESFTPVRRGAV
jgi:hypothetical protein